MQRVLVSVFITIIVLSSSTDGGRLKRQQSCSDSSSTRVNGKKACDGKIIFQDDFNSLDKDKWQNEVRFPESPDYEFVMYDDSRNNTYIKNGILHLKPTLMADMYGEEFLRTGSIHLDEFPPRCTNPVGNHQCSRCSNNGFRMLPPVISSKIRTYKSFKFRYGVVEIRAKMPAGDWIYSQVELIPRHNHYGPSKSGRIFVLTSRGNNDLKNPGVPDNRIDFGNRWVEGGVTIDTYNPTKTSTMVAQLSTHGGWHKDFHTYKFTWENDKMTWSVDDKKMGPGVVVPPEKGFLKKASNRMSPFDEDFFITMGVGVGGIQRFPDTVTTGSKAKPWKNTSPKNMMTFWKDKKSWYPTWKGDNSALQIDYIKVYAL